QIHVTNDKMVRYETAPVTLQYTGHFDNNFLSVDMTVGPGFVTHEAEGEHADTVSIGRMMIDRARIERLGQYYDMIGCGERDVTPENRPPATRPISPTQQR
ncbi:hypothetical protein PMAYCL1PPCAC_10092, partial [Pristionchus mayeri]